MRFWTLGVSLLLGCTALGCVTAESAGPRGYSESARALYEEGLDHLRAQNYEQAIATFEQVRARYPYSSYAALAELAVADTQFERGRYLEAIDAYQAFTRFHPSHPRLDYAYFRVAESHYKTIPTSFFLFPPNSERDQTAVRATLAAVEEFLDRYGGGSEYAERAERLRREVLGILARHELAVAHFHEARQKWEGAALRYRYLLSHYPGIGFDEEATLGLAHAEWRAGRPEEARRILEEFLRDHEGEAAAEARRLLSRIEGGAEEP